ncbi:MAG: rhodanese-like domain-containing protein [Tannerella sp.]|jgi:rhodanese-related sulfurtransferase|nr:rhodanese-like domain-containing protein [Tannerella sp.]
MGLFGNLFKSTPAVDLKTLISNGALLLDVRSKGEFAGGHASGSKNIPLDELTGKLSKLDKSKPIVAVCASGMRSGTAVNILKNNGFTEVYNGGSWTKYM